MTKTAAPSISANTPSPHVVIPGTPAGLATRVLRVVLLLSETKSSGLAALTVTVFEIVMTDPGAVTTMSNAAGAPFARAETVHVTVSP